MTRHTAPFFDGESKIIDGVEVSAFHSDDWALTKIERSDLSSKSFPGRQKLAQVRLKNSTFEHAIQEAKRLGYVCVVEVPSKQGPGKTYYLKRGSRDETLRCALANQGKNFCKNRTTYVLKGQDASDLECESSDDEGYGTAAEDLPRSFADATRDFFTGERGEDLSKVNPSRVPIEVNVSSKKNKKTKKKKKNLMPGLGDPIPRPGGGGHPRSVTRKERRAATKAWSLGQPESKAMRICEKIVGAYGTIIVYAPPQSGKTRFTIMTALLHLLEGITPIIITRRLKGDRRQFIDRINGLAELLHEHYICTREHWDDPKEDLLWTFEDGRSSLAVDNIVKKSDQTKIEEALVSNTPIIPVVLGNSSQLKKIRHVINNANIRTGKKCKYMLLIDECTDVDFGEAAPHILPLKANAVKTVSIDATPIGAFFADDSIKPEFTFYLPPDWKKYRGFNDFQVKFVEHDVCSLGKTMPWDEMIKADPNMVPWLDQMSQKGAWTSMNDTRSRVMRLCNTDRIENMDTQFKEIQKLYPDKFAIVEMHSGDRGKGTRIYNPVSRKTGEFKNGKFYDLSLTDAISLFNDATKFPRILCIVGRMGDRCLSFVSKDYNLHLNEDYITFPKDTRVGAMYQRMRMCGNNRGKGPLNLYITKSAYVDISKGIKLIDEFIERAKKMSNQSMRKSITTMPMFKGKFSTRKLAASKFKEKVNKVKGHDGGWSVDRYKQEIKDENGNVVDTVPLIVETPKKRKREDDYNIDDDDTYLKTQAFPKWAKISCPRTAICRFMQTIDPDTKYTERQAMSLWTGTKTNFMKMFRPRKGVTSCGHGVILKKNSDGTMQLRPELVEAYNQHFK